MAKQSFSVGQVLTAAQMTSLQQTAMLGGSTTAKTTSYTLVAADAGTVVSVNSTSATTITVNTGLFSAGDIVTIQNWGSGSVTITAGTATVNTAGSLIVPQYDGGVLYFTSASAAIYFDWVQAGATSPLTTKGDIWGYGSSDARIPIGTNGNVLTADSSQSLGLKWAAPAGGSTFAGVSLTRTTSLSLATATGVRVGFDTENFDTDGYHSNSTNNTRITIPSGKAGYYLFTGNLAIGQSATAMRGVQIYKNNTSNYGYIYTPGVSGADIAFGFSTVIYGDVGDYFEMEAYQNSGNTLTLRATVAELAFIATYLGA